MKIVSLILSFVLGFFTYPISFLFKDDAFDVEVSAMTAKTLTVNGKTTKINGDFTVDGDGRTEISEKTIIEIDKSFFDWFNYYAISYSSDEYVRGEITYRAGVKSKSESFFLEPGEEKTFYSFIDNCLNGTKANAVKSIAFEPLNCETARFSLNGISVFNRKIPEQEIYIENKNVKIGIDLLWGGALSYLEDLDSSVQVVEHNGEIKVDSNASERYGEEALNDNVNLINRNDTGRLVQQSYYGALESESYEAEYYNENLWNYNPVQGGNQYNENSKIIDIKIDDNLLYIKSQPLDWAKKKEYITPSYMEAYYTLEGKAVHVSCRFVDFSGYEPTVRTQEIPAFYCVEPLNNYVYYAGEKPWTNDELTYKKDLIFWPDAGYPNFTSSECWSAFTGEFEDSFGIGLYVPNQTTFLTGVFERGKTASDDPSREGPTSYIAVTKDMEFKSFAPFEYDYYITTGDVNEIREVFSGFAKQ